MTKNLMVLGAISMMLVACGSDDASIAKAVPAVEKSITATLPVNDRLTLDQEIQSVGVVSAKNSQTGLEVDFGVFKGKKIGIVALLPVPEVTIQTDACQAIITKNGGTSEFVNVDADQNKAAHAFESFIAQGDAALWNVSITGAELRAAIADANAKGMPFVSSYAGNEKGSVNIREDEWVSTPLLAQYIGNQLKGEGTVAVLGSNSIDVLLQRTKILEAVLAVEFPKIKVVRWPDFDFSMDGARKVAEEGLKADPSIKAIFAHWDIPASGGIQAAKNLGRDDLIITSYTGDNKTGYDLVRSGDLDATVSQSNRQVGVIACEYMALALAGKTIPADTLVPTRFVSKANVPEEVIVLNARPYVLSTEKITLGSKP
jgi:ABC-type sugar transport system substrate-binding protein